ncbi:MAG: ATP-binding cassette domain-containing protein [Flavobacteriales bacterium]|nr:MAG: ATP-binding cassette domain-containing protein [Flavobacteriales bacterium]
MNRETYIVPVKRLWALLIEERKSIYPIFFYAILNGIIILALPLGIQAILNFILGGRISTSWVLLVFLVTMALAFSGFIQISQLYLVEKLQQRIFAKSAFEFAYRIPRFKLKSLLGKYPPELINRFFDTMNIQKGVAKLLVDLTTALIQIFFGLLLLSVYHPFFVAFSLVLIIFVYILFRITSPKGMQTSLKESSSKYEMAFWLEEMARTLGTFKLAGYIDLPQQKVDKLAGNYIMNRQAHFRVLIQQYIIMITFKVLIVGTLLVTGSLLLINEEISVGQFVAAEVIIILVLGSIEKIILILDTVYDTLTATEKVGQIFDIELEKQSGKQVEETHPFKIEFRDVSFTYPNTEAEVLSGINLVIPSGQKVVITGPNGSGKSTLLHLIGGLYDSFKGKIFINDTDLNLFNLKALRAKIADSKSHQNIFRGTLRENITMGAPDGYGVGLKKILKITKLDDYVKTLQDGEETMMLPEGMMIPSDIVRKIILARSIFMQPYLLLLESSIISLKGQEKGRMVEFVFSQPYTVIAVSNDDVILQKAERILVQEDGQIVFDGDYKTFKAR